MSLFVEARNNIEVFATPDDSATPAPPDDHAKILPETEIVEDRDNAIKRFSTEIATEEEDKQQVQE